MLIPKTASRTFKILTRCHSSYVSGPSTVPLLGITVGQAVRQAASSFPSQSCIVSSHQGIRKTFSEMDSESETLAAGFLSLGMERGQRIGIWGTNSYEWYLTQFAAAKAGLVLVNINPAYQPQELLYCLNKVGVTTLVSSERFKTQDYYSMINQIAPGVAESATGTEIRVKEVPDLRNVVMLSEKKMGGTFKFSDVFDAGESSHFKTVQELETKIQMDDPVNIQFTSGTTGSPKGATLSHHNILNNGRFIGKRLGYDKKTHSICCSVPLYHCFGCVMSNLAALQFGAKVVLTAEHFNPEACLKAIEEEKCTSVYGTPTMFIDMLRVQAEKQFDLSSAETGIMAGAPCPQQLCTEITKYLNMKEFTVAFGATENSPVTFQGHPSDSFTLKTSTVGNIMSHMEAKVVDEKGDVVPFGVPGEMCTRGYSVMLGYWGDEEKTRECITPDRWYHSGDQAILHPNGYAQIVGRIKDMVIRGGENIYPREVEEEIHRHPAIEEVQVVGVPDYRLQEELCAWIRLKEGQTLTEVEIKKFCKGKLAHFKIPRYILFVDSFPTTVTGKVQKFKMVEQSIELLGIKVVK